MGRTRGAEATVPTGRERLPHVRTPVSLAGWVLRDSRLNKRSHNFILGRNRHKQVTYNSQSNSRNLHLIHEQISRFMKIILSSNFTETVLIHRVIHGFTSLDSSVSNKADIFSIGLLGRS